MPYLDRRGLPLSTTSDAAAAHYRDGVDLLLSAWTGAAESLEEAIAADPDFALAHAARARVHAVRGELAKAKARIATARALVAQHGTERERSHVEVLGLGIGGDAPMSLQRALSHLETWPLDALILSLTLGAFGLFAFSGRADHDQARVDLLEHHARHYGGADWWFLTHHGWAHVENGNVELGRKIAETSFRLRRCNANAVHALAHAMFEDGSGEDADALIAEWLPSYSRSAPLYSHISWHQALVALDEGDAERALAIYADRLQPTATAAAPLNVVTDSASLLWRLHVYGHHVPNELWEAVAAYAESAYPRAGLAFIDVHMALIAAATGNKAAFERRAAAYSPRAGAEATPLAAAGPAIGRAMLHFADQNYSACVEVLEPIAREVVRIGGSHAQREVIEDTLLIALMKMGATSKARTVLDRRLHRRLSQRDIRWRDVVLN